MLALYESSSDQAQTASLGDLRENVEAARRSGAKVVAIPPAFREDIPVQESLSFLKRQGRLSPAVWLGGIPRAEYYDQLYDALLQRNVRLLNDPIQFRRSMYLDESYPYLGELTFETIAVDDSTGLERAMSRFDGPMVVRTAVPRTKGRDWSQCLAQTRDQARELGESLLARPRVPGRPALVVRRWQPLRRMADGLTRELRVFVFEGTVLEMGAYWAAQTASMDDPAVAPALSLAREAQRRLDVPYLAVDVGELAEGGFVVLETWDAQCATTRTISKASLWTRLLRLASRLRPSELPRRLSSAGRSVSGSRRGLAGAESVRDESD